MAIDLIFKESYLEPIMPEDVGVCITIISISLGVFVGCIILLYIIRKLEGR